MTLSQDHFEDKVFSKFFISSVKFVPNKQFAECTNIRKAELMKKNEKGEYVDEAISAMWFGYSIAMKEQESAA